jgi:choline dehydrogenase-like flavoprotein
MVSSSSLRFAACLIALGPAAVLATALPSPDASAAVAVYDYIIVGGGTAGLTLAARLSANTAVTVLVIEAGPSVKGNDLIDIPGLLGAPIGSSLDWVVNTVPQASSNGHSYNWPRGKMLGGSSALNFMVWNRASVAEYNAWGTLGNAGWNWNTLSP